MKMSRRERQLLVTMASLARKLLTSSGATVKAGPPRFRRSRAEAVELRKRVLAARRRNLSVKDIAHELGITPSYVYQLQR